jgi:hypothetical protein
VALLARAQDLSGLTGRVTQLAPCCPSACRLLHPLDCIPTFCLRCNHVLTAAVCHTASCPRHAGITAEDALKALQQAGAAAEADEGDEGGGGGFDGATGGPLPDEDQAALEQFMQQRHTILRRLDSDEDVSDEEQQQQQEGAPVKRRKLAAGGPSAGGGEGGFGAAVAAAAQADEAAGETSQAAAAGPPAAAAAAGGAAKPLSKSAAAAVAKVLPPQPLIRVAVKAKQAPKPEGGGVQLPPQHQQQAVAGSDAGAGGILGLIGDYGSSSGDEGSH